MNDFSTKIVAFHQRHLCIRGTTTALYDYACGNEDELGNVSLIFAKKNHPLTNVNVLKKFQDRFSVVLYDSFDEVNRILDEIKCDVLYTIKYGYDDGDFSLTVPTIVHAVFDCDVHRGPSIRNASVSKSVGQKRSIEWLPHVVNPLPKGKSLRESLRIPNDAIVLGRYGGIETFDISWVHDEIRKCDSHSNVWFLFANTQPFFEHPRCIFMKELTTPQEKADFIETCDAMIHARSGGETFGLAIAEFSIAGRYIYTTESSVDNEHLIHLFQNGPDQGCILTPETVSKIWERPPKPKGPSPYEIFNQRNVMRIFETFLQK